MAAFYVVMFAFLAAFVFGIAVLCHAGIRR
jgi:hypothetical protein